MYKLDSTRSCPKSWYIDQQKGKEHLATLQPQSIQNLNPTSKLLWYLKCSQVNVGFV